MNVLVVGGGGYVGTSLCPAIEKEHRVRHFDIKPIPNSDPSSIVGDVTDVQLAHKAVEGMDAIVYLAMGSLKDDIESIRTSFDVNVQGAWIFLDAAAKAGVNRFIYTSTLSVYNAPHRPRDESQPPNEWRVYGLSKRVGEFICQAAADRFPKMCVISLRLNFPRNQADWVQYLAQPGQGQPSCALGPEDVRRLYLAALQCSKPGAHFVQATGDVDQKVFLHARIEQLIGWLPRGS